MGHVIGALAVRLLQIFQCLLPLTEQGILNRDPIGNELTLYVCGNRTARATTLYRIAPSSRADSIVAARKAVRMVSDEGPKSLERRLDEGLRLGARREVAKRVLDSHTPIAETARARGRLYVAAVLADGAVEAANVELSRAWHTPTKRSPPSTPHGERPLDSACSTSRRRQRLPRSAILPAPRDSRWRCRRIQADGTELESAIRQRTRQSRDVRFLNPRTATAGRHCPDKRFPNDTAYAGERNSKIGSLVGAIPSDITSGSKLIGSQAMPFCWAVA